ncbi:hypothetical protein BDB01DRAFT_846646 [Pilobolus umbonatus]|nr:hypothetical protein BDB01DRAFT_846646 [Pilobolus umbonatus]
MSYTPYTLQTILTHIEEPVPGSTNSNSFFARIPIVPPNEPSNVRPSSWIQSVGAWDSDIYCGTSEGSILHYSIESTSSNRQNFKTKLESIIDLGLGKKPVERILLIPQVSKAVVLCDSILSFFSLPFFELIPASFIPPIKGVSCFTHDIGEEDKIGEDGTVEIAVVKRRNVHIYKIGESMHLKKELPLADGAITITRYGRIICLADSHIYKLIDLQIPSITLLIPTPQIPVSSKLTGTQMIPRPILTVVRKDEFLVVSGTADNHTIGIFVNAKGDAIRGTLQWSGYPKDVRVEFPYVTALLRSNVIEIHNILDQKLLQTIPVDPSLEAKGMILGHGLKIWMDVLAKKLKRDTWPDRLDAGELHSQMQREIIRYSTSSARILIYSRHSVMAQVSTPLIIQVDGLLESHNLEAALELADQAEKMISSNSDTTTERLKSELCYTFQKSGLLLLKETVFDDAFSLLSRGNMDPRVVIHLFEGLSQDKWLKETPPILLFDGVRSLIDKLGSIDQIVNDSIQQFTTQDASGSSEIKKTLQANAQEALLRYLLIERSKKKEHLGQNDVICRAIDTSLLKIYLTLKDDPSVYLLLQQKNDCCIEGSSQLLLDAEKYYALSTLYEQRHMYEKVLEIWTKIYTGELEDRDFKDGINRVKRLLLKDIHPEELPLPIVMKYIWWLTNQNAKDGVEVLTRSPRKDDMDADEILVRLEGYSNEAVRTYLEYLVLTQKSERAEYHTRLACSYVKDVETIIKDKNELQSMNDLVDDFKYHVACKQTRITTTEQTEGHTDEHTFVEYLGNIPNQTHLIRMRLLLIRLLQRSTLYSPQELLKTISRAGPLLIEEVIVYGRMNNHKEALGILIHALNDFVGAEIYCITNGQSIGDSPTPKGNINQVMPRSSSLSNQKVQKPFPPIIQENEENLSTEQLSQRQQLFTMLFDSFLSIKDRDKMMVRIMHLLNTQGIYLDIIKVLQSIPDHWPIHLLEQFLTRSMRRTLDVYNESKIVVGLARGENLMRHGPFI